MTYARLRSIRLYEQIVARIRAQILDDELREGDQLPNERELAARFGVSRTVVREAIKALAKEGLVEVRQGSGTYVANRTVQALSDSLDLMLSFGGAQKRLTDLTEVREIVEPGVAALAAARATPEDLAQMQRALDTMEQAGADVDVFVQADHQFHIALARATRNDTVAMLLDSVVDLMLEQRKQIFFVKESSSNAQKHHKRIIAAIRKRDPVAARNAMLSHIRQVRGDVVALAASVKQAAKK